MGTPVIGAILVLLELQPGGRGTDRDAVQQPPERLIVKFREVADCVLQGSRGRSLGTAHPGGDDLIDAIAGLHAVAAGGGVLLIWGNFHVGGKAGTVVVQIKFPPAVVAPVSVLIIAMPYPILLPPWVPNGPLGRGFLRPVWDRGGCEGVVPVICYWIGRRILVQIYDLTVDGGLC